MSYADLFELLFYIKTFREPRGSLKLVNEASHNLDKRLSISQFNVIKVMPSLRMIGSAIQPLTISLVGSSTETFG